MRGAQRQVSVSISRRAEAFILYYVPGKKVATFETEHDSHLRIVSWNPKHFMVASACTKLVCYYVTKRCVDFF